MSRGSSIGRASLLCDRPNKLTADKRKVALLTIDKPMDESCAKPTDSVTTAEMRLDGESCAIPRRGGSHSEADYNFPLPTPTPALAVMGLRATLRRSNPLPRTPPRRSTRSSGADNVAPAAAGTAADAQGTATGTWPLRTGKYGTGGGGSAHLQRSARPAAFYAERLT